MNIQDDPMREREINFLYKGEKYHSRFRNSGVMGWTIFNERGIICPENSYPDLWKYFKEKKQPQETKVFGL